MSEPFLGEIKMVSFGFPPRGWAFCNGQLLPINQNQALFSILGTTYGGDGRLNFALPDLRGRVPVHVGQNIALGERDGEAAHTLIAPELPTHTHGWAADANTPATSNTAMPAGNAILGQSTGVESGDRPYTVRIYNPPQSLGSMAPQAISTVGGSQPHQNMQPFLGLCFIIALQGIFPSQT